MPTTDTNNQTSAAGPSGPASPASRLLYLVYQRGIANVFSIQATTDRGTSVPNGRVRLVQSTFGVCEAFCAGAMAAGARVRVAHDNDAGDALHHSWHSGTGGPFRREQHPPKGCVLTGAER